MTQTEDSISGQSFGLSFTCNGCGVGLLFIESNGAAGGDNGAWDAYGSGDSNYADRAQKYGGHGVGELFGGSNGAAGEALRLMF